MSKKWKKRQLPEIRQRILEYIASFPAQDAYPPSACGNAPSPF